MNAKKLLLGIKRTRFVVAIAFASAMPIKRYHFLAGLFVSAALILLLILCLPNKPSPGVVPCLSY